MKGRKRHMLVDTLGLLLAVYITPADLHESSGARCLLAGLAPLLPCLQKIWSDVASRGQELAKFCEASGNWDLEGVERPAGTRGFSVQPWRWVVERCFAWLIRNRRLAKDYERKVQTSSMSVSLVAIRLLLRRLAGHIPPGAGGHL
jgi:putative transposase